MIDLHTHTIWSDGELVPAEHIRRAMVSGYKAIAITDHADISNIDLLCQEVVKFATTMNKLQTDIIVLPGVEITHVLPEEIQDLVKYARGHGIQIVAVHGETIMEPVRFGTNMAAIQAKVDFLAHPGFISEEEVELAVQNNVCLEITARKGHSLTNGYVAKLGLKYHAKMIINTDTHTHNDFISGEMAEKVLLGAGIEQSLLKNIFQNSEDLVKSKVLR